MRRIPLILAFLYLPILGGPAYGGDKPGNGGLYGQRIVLDIKSNDPPTIAAKAGVPQARAAADELAGWLEKITGKKFDVSAPSADNPSGGIFLLSASSPLVAQADRDRLKDKGLDAFILRGDADKLQIISNDWRSEEHTSELQSHGT
jgi:hypothetical protein